jgi:hypothetical protein
MLLLRRLASYQRASGKLLPWALARREIDGRAFSLAGHAYLRGIYEDEAPSMVVRKAAQMGASEYAITRSLHFAIHRGGRTIYFFPSDNDVGEFSRDRFAPAVDGSPYLKALIRDTDTAGLKQIGRGSIYFRGTRSRTRMKSVPADFLVFDELDEMAPGNVVLAEKRLGHSEWGWVLKLSTPSLPEYGIDAAFSESDQRHWLLRCQACGKWWCLEDEFVRHHGSGSDPRQEICFISGEPGREELVCLSCGHRLDPERGAWVAKHPKRRVRGYQLSKFYATVVSEQDREQGLHTRPAVLLAEWRQTRFPEEFWNSEVGLPYLAAEGGLTEEDLLAIEGGFSQQNAGRSCVMGVDQGNGLHVVVKEPADGGLVLTVRTYHEPVTDATFSHLDHLMEAFDVRACVIDALPNTHAARAFARRFRGRVWLCFYAKTQKGQAAWGRDQEHSPTVNVNRTESLDAWRDAHKLKRRRIPKEDPEVREFRSQMTNVLRKVEEEPETGEKRAVWIRRGPDHFAHADNYAEIALGRLSAGVIRASVVG